MSRPQSIWRFLVAAGTLLATACSSSAVAGSDSLPSELDGATVSLPIEVEDPSGESAGHAIRVALTDAVVRWSEAEVSDYRIEVEENGNFWISGCRWMTVVAEGVVVESSVDASSTGQYCETGDVWTVEGLHEMVSGLADSLDLSRGVAGAAGDPLGDVDTLDVKFSEVGVPESIVFDLAGAADEERVLRVRFIEQN